MKKFSKKLGAIILSLALILVIAPVSAIFAGCGENNPPAENPPVEEATIEGEYICHDYCQDDEDPGEDYTLVEELEGTSSVYKYDNFSVTVTITADSWDGLINTESLDNNGRLFSELFTDPTMTWEEYEGFLVLHLNYKEKPSDTEYQDQYFIGQIVDTEIIVSWLDSTSLIEAKVAIDEFIDSGCERLYQYFGFCGFGG